MASHLHGNFGTDVPLWLGLGVCVTRVVFGYHRIIRCILRSVDRILVPMGLAWETLARGSWGRRFLMPTTQSLKDRYPGPSWPRPRLWGGVTHCVGADEWVRRVDRGKTHVTKDISFKSGGGERLWIIGHRGNRPPRELAEELAWHFKVGKA